MIKKFSYIVLIVALLTSARLGTGAPQNWESKMRKNMDTWKRNFKNEMNQFNQNLRDEMNRLNQNLHLQQLQRENEFNQNQQTLQYEMDQLNKNLHLQELQRQNSLQSMLAQVNKTIANLPKDASQESIKINGAFTSDGIIGKGSTLNGCYVKNINTINGLSKIVMSGHTPNGEPYVRIIEERKDRKYLYRNETIYNIKTNATENISLKLDLTIPDARHNGNLLVDASQAAIISSVISNGIIEKGLTVNGCNIRSINTINGLSEIVVSGHTSNGEPYVRIIETRRDRKYLYHNETIYNKKTNATESIRLKLDLTIPGAKPEILTDE
ncbi:PREDICTED: uncharacterized protein LOC105453226 isoform X2 [Wasmannia auropunctata]|uniref:uncharacterized protein LOC105453226 isoform X2 n=1 Tax=Wasmannia auropunctata TaxID=64793 RepID=UPI0005EFF884|nr:PREDICTED: uncharacterized protein LOC105453226 isoform X2 [Wasmannia auropunctata]XP_011693299.1 PREDICTED: uncharacterized protein LOC105453226 isoform X2 [Wasmannia auropunctata]XP_011693300.1 PREDICTED: uncharacterized protein LOC105453226 isoform X2 [Wasmannia auropunctata]XP_011693301.1 PREDICTED: uncharacterized protein LOC105453226 isoform X2 [Wasmannia auropunctata]